MSARDGIGFVAKYGAEERFAVHGVLPSRGLLIIASRGEIASLYLRIGELASVADRQMLGGTNTK